MSYDSYVLCSLQGSVDARFISAKKSILYSVVPHLVRECESALYQQFYSAVVVRYSNFTINTEYSVQ